MALDRQEHREAGKKQWSSQRGGTRGIFVGERQIEEKEGWTVGDMCFSAAVVCGVADVGLRSPARLVGQLRSSAKFRCVVGEALFRRKLHHVSPSRLHCSSLSSSYPSSVKKSERRVVIPLRNTSSLLDSHRHLLWRYRPPTLSKDLCSTPLTPRFTKQEGHTAETTIRVSRNPTAVASSTSGSPPSAIAAFVHEGRTISSLLPLTKLSELRLFRQHADATLTDSMGCVAHCVHPSSFLSQGGCSQPLSLAAALLRPVGMPLFHEIRSLRICCFPLSSSSSASCSSFSSSSSPSDSPPSAQQCDRSAVALQTSRALDSPQHRAPLTDTSNDLISMAQAWLRWTSTHSRELFHRLRGIFSTRLLLVNTVTAGALFGAADLTCQVLFEPTPSNTAADAVARPSASSSLPLPPPPASLSHQTNTDDNGDGDDQDEGSLGGGVAEPQQLAATEGTERGHRDEVNAGVGSPWERQRCVGREGVIHQQPLSPVCDIMHVTELTNDAEQLETLPASQNQSTASEELPSAAQSSIDWIRTLRMTSFGCVCTGPVYTLWYGRVIKAYASLYPNSLLHAVILPTLADAFIVGPIMIAAFHLYMCGVSGKTWDQTEKQLRSEMPPACIANYIIWPPLQFVNFKYVPACFQAAVVCVADFFWCIYLSWSANRNGAQSISRPVCASSVASGHDHMDGTEADV